MTTTIWVSIGIIFVIVWSIIIWEIKNAPLLPDDYDWEDDPDVLDFLEQADKPGSWDKKHDKSFTVGGLTNDKKGDFMKFQKKQNNNLINKKNEKNEKH